MILTGSRILHAVAEGDIVIEPFDRDRISTNSYDFTLGNTLLTYDNEVLDPRVDEPVTEHVIPPEGFVLRGGGFYLASPVERMGSSRFVPIIRGRSSIARLGLFVHITADLIDIGSVNVWTLQLAPVLDIRVFPGMRIGQVTFWETLGDIELYAGKYRDTTGPAKSRGHMDKCP